MYPLAKKSDCCNIRELRVNIQLLEWSFTVAVESGDTDTDEGVEEDEKVKEEREIKGGKRKGG